MKKLLAPILAACLMVGGETALAENWIPFQDSDTTLVDTDSYVDSGLRSSLSIKSKAKEGDTISNIEFDKNHRTYRVTEMKTLDAKGAVTNDFTYSDDPLRMLRAIRFATKLSTPEMTFTIVPESLDAMRRMKDRMEILSKERIVEELNKILITPHPSMGFRLMDETGLLDYVLPQLAKLKGVETVEGRGHKDNFSHTIQVVDHVAQLEQAAIAEGRLHNYSPVEDGSGFVETVRTEPFVWLRWAALLHDIGKPVSKRWDPAAGWTFHGHEVVGAKMVPKIFQALKMPLNEKMKYVQKLVGLHHRPVALVDEEVTDSAVRRLLFDAGNEIDDLMLLCNADITSKNPAKVARLKRNFELVREKLVEVEAKDAIRNWKNPITGEYIMEVYGIGPCNTIGRLKEAIKDAVLDGKVANTFEATDAYMRSIAADYGLVPVK